VLPESLPKKNARRISTGPTPIRSALKLLRRYPQVLGLIGVLFLMALAHMVYPRRSCCMRTSFRWGHQMATLAGVACSPRSCRAD
jgi:DHA1 family tetracycline resistance protein-like MFS transporter